MSNLPPWHTWGAQKTLEVPIVLTNNFGRTEQISRVNYGRPDTWRVFLFARPHNNSLTNNQLTNLILGVRFQFAIGVGRTLFDTANSPDGANFAQQFVWQVPATSSAVIRPKWTDKIFIPELDDRNVSPTPITDQTSTVIADKIQASASVFCDAGFAEIPLNSVCKIDVGIFLAPNVHVRPEWWVGEFPANEDQPGDG
jgi:hypothetical protein